MKLDRGHRIGWMLLLGGCLTFAARADTASLFTNLNGPRAAGRPRLPGIIFIQCESLGYLDLSCYGQKQFATPNLDRLAAGGMLFTNYDARGAGGPEARAALLLGHAVGTAPATLPQDESNLAQVLKATGYFTGYLGEWDFGGQGSGSAPWEKGFDDFAGFFTPAEAGNYYAASLWRCAPRSILNTTNHQWENFIGRETLKEAVTEAHGAYVPDLYTRAALGFIKQYQPNSVNHHRPFFLWVNYPIARPNLPEAARTGNGVQVPTDAPYSEQNWPQPEKNKAAMIARLDNDVGQILDFLAKWGLTNSVAVFFSSATVPQKAGGLDPSFFPSVLSTNDQRLPMIASWPQHIPAGTVSGVHWSPADFLPTVAQMAMTAYPTNQVGKSILPVLYGQMVNNEPPRN